MIRYIMTFSIDREREQTAKKIINSYFEALYKQGPGGMRSQCYSDDENEYSFVHIKSFVRESVAREHFKSPIFNDYISRLSKLCESTLNFTKLYQEKTFESIY